MATEGPSARGLTLEQIEQLTDLMVSKLAMVRVVNAPEGETLDKLRRDEIQLVIVDTDILLGADDSAAMLEHWLESA